MKTSSVTITAIVAVILGCALTTGGQQQSEKGQKQTPDSIPAAPKRKTPAKPSDWRMPDGRVVEFPASTSKEEIDALAKRIAEGAIELPLGARVIGWEPVEGATSLPLFYEQRVATIPTTKGKLDALANAAGILQTQIHSQDILTSGAFSRIVALEKHDDELTNVVNVNAAVAGNADSSLLTLTNQLNVLKRELDEFKDAACPILRRADGGMKLNYACGLH